MHLHNLRRSMFTLLAVSAGTFFSGTFLSGSLASAAPDDNDKQEQAASDQAARFEEFEKTMSGVKLVGRFTILGRDNDMPKEEYTINSVKKMPNGDYWMFNARIKYGKNDLTVPLPLQVKWAGDTPVITLTELTIPALGTFSSRVVIYNKKYSGTWTHGKVGGHLFGTIEPIKQEEEAGTE